jgi:hypothetical protein
MGIQYASKTQVETLRESLIKCDIEMQQFAQGSKRGTRIPAAEVTRIDALITALNVAVDAVIAAVVDVTPSAFVFTDVTGAVVSTVYVSNAITVAGISDNTPVAITVTGGLYSINGGPYVSAAGTVVAGDIVRARAVSSGTAATAVNVAVTIGGVSDTYTVTTA